MNSFFQCMAYSDVESSIRLADNVVYIGFKDDLSNVHLTFNPIQILILTKKLQFALADISISNITLDENFGDMTVEISDDDYEEDEMNIAVPF